MCVTIMKKIKDIFEEEGMEKWSENSMINAGNSHEKVISVSKVSIIGKLHIYTISSTPKIFCFYIFMCTCKKHYGSALLLATELKCTMDFVERKRNQASNKKKSVQSYHYTQSSLFPQNNHGLEQKRAEYTEWSLN